METRKSAAARSSYPRSRRTPRTDGRWTRRRIGRCAATREGSPSPGPGHGRDQVKGYLRASQHNVQFVFSSNGHLFVEFDGSSGMTTAPRPISEFPSPADLRARYEKVMGFSLDEPIAKPLLTRYVGGE